METTETTIDGVTVLKLAGRLDGLAAPELEKKVLEIVSRSEKRIVFDCSGVEYASSAGLRVFLVAAKQLKTGGGRCGFAALTPALRDIFSVSGFLDIFEVHDSLEQAVA